MPMMRNGVRADLVPLICPVCGKETMKPAHVRTCSYTCAVTLKREHVQDCICKLCGQAFQRKGYPTAGATNMLCPECKERSHRQKMQWLKCPVCGKEGWRDTRYLTCSRRCGNVLQWRPRKKWASQEERVLAKAARRRILMKNVDGIIEAINPKVIYERDGGRCGICGKKVASDQISIDHIIPLSLGGQHTENNVRLAHIRCNVQRGNRGPAQLRLQVLS